MVLIFLSWLYIIFTAVNLGVLCERVFKFKTGDFIVVNILGLFITTIIATVWAIFGRIYWEFHLFLLLLNLALLIKMHTLILPLYKNFGKQLSGLKLPLKILLAAIAFLIIAQCAAAPYLPDNESYYIQTIKWINQYGLVKGISNLHIFLAQNSGWHILQAVFSFSFLYEKFNDLSGFCLLLGNAFAVIKLDSYFKDGKTTDLIAGLLPLANVLLFAFISSPSPDIAIYILTFVVFYFFIKCFDHFSFENFAITWLFVLFALFIKVTALPLILVPLFLFIKYFRLVALKVLPLVIISSIILGLFITKNIISSGYALYPLTEIGAVNLNFTIPDAIIATFADQSRAMAFGMTTEAYHNANALELFMNWLQIPKLDGFFNSAIVIFLLSTPVLVYRKLNAKKYWLLYAMMLSGMFFLYFTSPQYRFFLNFILMFSFLWIASFYPGKKTILTALYAMTFAAAAVLLLPTAMQHFTNNKLMSATSNFKTTYVVFPHGNSKHNHDFELEKLGNLKYYTPLETDFFWGNGDGKLPCVNKQQLQYFEKYFHLRPQKIGGSFKDGFYSQQIPEQ